MTAGKIIRAARAEDASFDDRRHPGRDALAYLSRLQERLVSVWAEADPDAYQDELEIAFPLADFDEGVELVEIDAESGTEPIDVTRIRHPLSVWVRGEDVARDLPLISWRDRNRGPWALTCYEDGGRLRFSGTADRWKDVERVVLTYVATPPTLEQLDDELVLPSSARDALVCWVADFFARRSKADEIGRTHREFRADAVDAEALWVDQLRRRRGARFSRTRMVW